MSGAQFALTIALCTAATMLTRFLPFLIVYCLKGVRVFAGSHGIPESLAIAVTIALHKWKHETLLSIAGGTLCYVLLVQLVFA